MLFSTTAPARSAYDEEAVSLLTSMSSLEDEVLNEKVEVGKWRSRRSRSQALIWRCMFALLPSFIASRFVKPDGGRPPSQEKLRPTAYLDGLRGVAAWTVLNAHLSAVVTKSSGAGWGRDETHREFFKLPFFRLLYNGNFAVAIFFIVSGFALSISYISTLRQSPRDPATAFRKLSSSIFRRPMRLFLPSWVSIFLVFILIRLNFFSSLQARQTEFEDVVAGWPVLPDWPPRYRSTFPQFLDMLVVCGDMLKVFTGSLDDSFRLAYNSVLWTIKLEFRASLALFLTHIALYFISKRGRVLITSALIVIGVAVHAFDVPHFWVGYLIAEQTDLTALGQKSVRPLRWLLAWFTLVLGLFLGSFAAWQPEETPWCAWLIPFTPFNFQPLDRFWVGIGAALVVGSFSGLPWLVRLFNSRLIQYMGKISFALYLVHFWMVQCVGTVIFYNVWSLTGKESPLATTVGFVVGYCLTLGATVWVADLFWRCIDIPFVSLAAKWQKQLFREM